MMCIILLAPVLSVPISRRDLPRDVDRVLERVLVKTPADSYSSAGELAVAFRDAFSGRPQRPATLAAAPELAPGAASDAAAPTIDTRCPECGATLPAGAGICPACKFMIPLDQPPKAAPRPRLEPSQAIV